MGGCAGWIGWFKHGPAIPSVHFNCIPPLVTSMKNFIEIGQKLLWLGWSKLFHWFIFGVNFHTKASHKVSALQLKAFKNYPIIKNDKSGFWVDRVGGWGGLMNPRHTIFSNTVSYTKLNFPTKFYQNRAKVCHLGGFWMGGLDGWVVWIKHRVCIFT